MNYDNLTVESIAQYCAEKSNFKINKADLESQIQHLINVKQAKQLILSGVGSSNDKKQLIEDLLECVNDATDTQTAMTGMTMCAMLMSEVIDQALTLTDVSQQRELLKEIYDLTGGAWGDPVISEDLYNRIEKAISFNCG